MQLRVIMRGGFTIESQTCNSSVFLPSCLVWCFGFLICSLLSGSHAPPLPEHSTESGRYLHHQSGTGIQHKKDTRKPPGVFDKRLLSLSLPATQIPASILRIDGLDDKSRRHQGTSRQRTPFVCRYQRSITVARCTGHDHWSVNIEDRDRGLQKKEFPYIRPHTTLGGSRSIDVKVGLVCRTSINWLLNWLAVLYSPWVTKGNLLREELRNLSWECQNFTLQLHIYHGQNNSSKSEKVLKSYHQWVKENSIQYMADF